MSLGDAAITLGALIVASKDHVVIRADDAGRQFDEATDYAVLCALIEPLIPDRHMLVVAHRGVGRAHIHVPCANHISAPSPIPGHNSCQRDLWRSADCRSRFDSLASAAMDRFNLNLFFALDAILHAETLTEAAHNVHLSQPAMSVSLKKLRAYFNDELVVNQGGAARLTPLAMALKPRIRQALQTSREALNLSLDFDPAVDLRSVRVTAADVVELIYLSRVTARIARAAPNVDITSIPFTYRPVDALFRENIDVAIVSESFSLPQYPVLPLFHETLSCMVWKDSQAFGETLSEAQYFAAKHAAMFQSVERQAHPVGAALQRLNYQRNITVRASVYSALPHMIVGTDLIVTTLTRFAHLCARTMPIRILPLPVEIPAVAFVAQWQGYRSDEPIMQWLLEQLRDAAAGI